jgi:hypothetical protein
VDQERGTTIDNEILKGMGRHMRVKHIIGGLVVFSVGLFLCYLNSALVVEFIKGALQPILILVAIWAAAGSMFGNTRLKTVTGIIAALCFLIGIYGLYDEYYTVLDFFTGLLPLLLILGGVVSVTYGIKMLRNQESKVTSGTIKDEKR